MKSITVKYEDVPAAILVQRAAPEAAKAAPTAATAPMTSLPLADVLERFQATDALISRLSIQRRDIPGEGGEGGEAYGDTREGN